METISEEMMSALSKMELFRNTTSKFVQKKIKNLFLKNDLH